MKATAASPALWRWCLAAGLLTLLCSWGFGRIPGLVACGDAGGLGPILAFEFAQTPADVAALFGAEPCRSTLIAAQRKELLLDALGFIPSYTAFMTLAAWAAGGRARGLIVAALLVAGLSDEVEGALLFAVLRDLPGTPALLAALFWPVHVKFALLGLGTGAVGLSLFGRSISASLIGSLAAVFGLAAAATLVAASRKTMMQAFTDAWTALLLAAAIGAFWPRLLAPRLPAPASPSA